jgi:hypothetical protein
VEGRDHVLGEKRQATQDFVSSARSDALMRIGFFHWVGVAGHQNAEFHYLPPAAWIFLRLAA